MPLQATSGAASYDAFGGGVAAVPQYIEDVFSTWLYTGTSAPQTLPNGIDTATKGGLIWIKSRSGTTLPTYDKNMLFDTARGNTVSLSTNNSSAEEGGWGDSYLRFRNNGFDTGTGGTSQQEYMNKSGVNYASWTFREAPKFFDVVTYTGTGTASQTISHNLGSAPGCIIIKRTDSTSDWFVGHTYDVNKLSYLNTTAASTTLAWNSWQFNTTTFRTPSISGSPDVNVSGATYVAYLFAHNAGGFGLTGTDNVISCGSFTAVNNNATVNLGWEPQWVLYKRTNLDGQWNIVDNMRGWSHSGSVVLHPNLSDAEEANSSGAGFITTSTGFQGTGQFSNAPFIYIAIRRGPMAVPTTGTSVFAPVAASSGTQTTNFPVDMMMQTWRGSSSALLNTQIVDRLRGVSSTSTAMSKYLITSSTGAEDSDGATGSSKNYNNVGFDTPPDYAGGAGGNVFQCFRRAPGFFDEVCFTQASGTQNHNLGVAPELVILKSRSTADSWYVFAAQNGFGELNRTVAWAGLGNGSGLGVNLANVTSTTLSRFGVFGTGNTAVAYLFASAPGVSKVGSYTGTGTTQVINCGFTAGSRFVMIKRTDSTGDWYVWDTARGMIPANDPYLLLNSTAAEVTNTDFVDTAATGFEISSTAPAAINASGGTFIFFAVA